MIGTYEIAHLPSGRAYVGSSDNVTRRLRAHRGLLRRGEHFNRALQEAWDRDSEEGFAFRALEPCAVAQLRQVEADLLAARGPARVFNTSPVVRPGARAPNAALSDASVLAIYQRAAAGEPATDLAAEFGIACYTAQRIIAGKTYTDLTGGIRAREPLGQPRAERNANTKLSAPTVREIRRRLAHGEGCGPLAREYGVTHRAVVCVRDRLTWAHVD
jgi:hypothetical protein